MTITKPKIELCQLDGVFEASRAGKLTIKETDNTKEFIFLSVTDGFLIVRNLFIEGKIDASHISKLRKEIRELNIPESSHVTLNTLFQQGKIRATHLPITAV